MNATRDTDIQDRILACLRRERVAGPAAIARALGAGRGAVGDALDRLLVAGKVRKVERGLYEVAA